MKSLLAIIVICFFPMLGKCMEQLEIPEKFFRQAIKDELEKRQVAGGVFYYVADEGLYFHHRIAVRSAKKYFNLHQKNIDVELLLDALESDEVFVRDSSFEVIKFMFPEKIAQITKYNPFAGKKVRADSLKVLRDLLKPNS
jgi:phosphatidylserine/phosphatidylglycerophosphate/cardiolipin synthase-like enzyme